MDRTVIRIDETTYRLEDGFVRAFLLSGSGKAILIDTGDTVQDGHIFMFGAHRAPELFEAALEKLIGLKGEYDVIYPSHGTPELPNDYAEKVLQDWRSVRSGAVPFELTEIMGTTVKSCTAEQCGFYLS